MRLSDVVETSRRVGEVGGRLAKIAHLADRLAQAGPEEAAGAVALLSGTPRQGRIGVGYAALRAARAEPAARDASLTLAELERALEGLKAVKGTGAAGERARLLRELFGRATEAEQDFLLRLLVGELRQGALEGVMVEAIARAAALPAAGVRRAVMLAGDAGVVAAAALGEGAGGARALRARADAAGAADAGAAGRGHRRRAGAARAGGVRVEARWRAHPGPQGPRRGAGVHAAAERRHRRGAGGRERGARAAARECHPRRRGDRAQAGRAAAAVPDHHAALRSQARGGAAAGRAAARLPVLRCAGARWRRR